MPKDLAARRARCLEWMTRPSPAPSPQASDNESDDEGTAVGDVAASLEFPSDHGLFSGHGEEENESEGEAAV